MKARECVAHFEKKFNETGHDMWWLGLEVEGVENARSVLMFATISYMYDLVKMRSDRWEVVTGSLEVLVGEEDFHVEVD